MRTITSEELATILANHKKWWLDEEGGVRANLSDADLSDADLSDADLRRANLRRADLSGANLSGADLSDANLSGADLRRANLSDANLSDANLSGANLRRANLSDANLRRANLSDANLSGANLRRAKKDFLDILNLAKDEVPGLLAALKEGRINGSAYEGECACLVGTIAKIRTVYYRNLQGITPDCCRPAERIFLAIRKGDTPETNPVSAIVVEWINEWMSQPKEEAVEAL